MKKTLIAVFTVFIMIMTACGGSDSASDNESSAEEAPSSSGTSEDSSSVGDEIPITLLLVNGTPSKSKYPQQYILENFLNLKLIFKIDP